jgi:hypothetical protein
MGSVAGMFVWRPESYVTEPPAFAIVQVRRDAWWLTDAEGRVCFYVGPWDTAGAPQMNSSRGIAERFASRTPGCVGVKQIPFALVPVRQGE